ncbi:MAG: S24/S26 family peptidase [Desulfobacterales bacterium]|nr:S24/S26 family peptidase [Desulfobacterales bacterium]
MNPNPAKPDAGMLGCIKVIFTFGEHTRKGVHVSDNGPNFQEMQPVIKRLDSLGLSGKALGILVKAFTEQGRMIRFTARGDSMFPFIKDGDVIRVTPYGDVLPAPGDMAAFIDSVTEKLVVHRIMRLSQDRFVTKGDHCFHEDNPQPYDNILGFISEINSRNGICYGINYIKIKRYVTFLSRFNLTAIFGKLLKRKYY